MLDQNAMSAKSQMQSLSLHTTSIHILDNDSLLHIFYLYRPAIFDGDEDDDVRAVGGKGWDREQWWYKLAHVCQRWRNLILGSSSYLGLCLVCTFGTPVADMLAHSPPLPLIIDYTSGHDDIAAEDEEGIAFALGQRDRLHRIRLQMPFSVLRKFIMAIDEEHPILEYLIMGPLQRDKSTVVILSETLQAPHLRHLSLYYVALPMGSRSLTTAVGLVTLCLFTAHPSAYFQPNTLLRWISFMPQLETLVVDVLFPVPSLDVSTQLSQTPIITHVTLPNLRFFWFRGDCNYVEAVVHRISASHLERLDIGFFEQPTFSVPGLLQFLNTTENLRFESAKFLFSGEQVNVGVYPREGAKMYGLGIVVGCWHLDRQVSSVAQIFNTLGQKFSTVENLTLNHEIHSRSSDEHNEVDRSEWYRFLRSFSNVKTLRVDAGLSKELSRCLRLDDGESPSELLPELQELTYYGSGDTDAFTSFIDDRRNAGRLVTLIRR